MFNSSIPYLPLILTDQEQVVTFSTVSHNFKCYNFSSVLFHCILMSWRFVVFDTCVRQIPMQYNTTQYNYFDFDIELF